MLKNAVKKQILKEDAIIESIRRSYKSKKSYKKIEKFKRKVWR